MIHFFLNNITNAIREKNKSKKTKRLYNTLIESIILFFVEELNQLCVPFLEFQYSS